MVIKPFSFNSFNSFPQGPWVELSAVGARAAQWQIVTIAGRTTKEDSLRDTMGLVEQNEHLLSLKKVRVNVNMVCIGIWILSAMGGGHCF